MPSLAAAVGDAAQIAAWSSSMRKRGALAERTLTAGQAGPGESRWWLTLYVSRPPPVTVIRNDAVVHLHGSGNHNVGGGHDRRWAVGTAAALLSRVATKAMRTPCFGHLTLLPANHSKDDMARPMVPPRTRRPQPGARPVTPLPTDGSFMGVSSCLLLFGRARVKVGAGPAHAILRDLK